MRGIRVPKLQWVEEVVGPASQRRGIQEKGLKWNRTDLRRGGWHDSRGCWGGGEAGISCLTLNMGGNRSMRRHQKGHVSVYYIEKREGKKKVPKPDFQGLKTNNKQKPTNTQT